MRVLVDTHCWLWLQVSPERFNADLLAQLANSENEILLSAASAWEMAIEYSLNQLPLPAPPGEYIPSRMRLSGTAALPVLHTHALGVAQLPPHHRDPFDRLIIAQAQHERIAVVTADRQFDPYEVETLRP